MSIYLKKLQQFRSSVKLGDFVRSTSSFNFKDISTCYYKKIVTIMGQGWEEKTLQDAENFKNKLAEECLIQPFLARIHASISSIALIVYLPPRVEVKMEELESFFKTRNVSQVILDDSCFFDRTKEVPPISTKSSMAAIEEAAPVVPKLSITSEHAKEESTASEVGSLSDQADSSPTPSLTSDVSDSDDYEEVPPPWSTYQPQISSESTKNTIKAAMKAHGVKENDIPADEYFASPEDAAHSERFFEVPGFAWFACPNKHRYWPSANAWCVIDLRTQTISYRYIQRCQGCGSEASPEFTEEALEKMAERAVKSFLRRTGKLVHDELSTGNDGAVGGGPHDEERCGRCRRLGHSCWK